MWFFLLLLEQCLFGVNIKNLHNLILAHPFKAKIRILQSIGRTLRKSSNDKIAQIFDITDNFCHGKHKNFAAKHGLERVKIYESEGFPISFDSVEL
jgi:superfamily II DNA or RNA helicase